jgi:cyclomaltodextrinase
MDEIITPEWVKHAVFYQIFPDRFAKSAAMEKPSNLEPWDSEPTTFGYKGGDLYGVVEKLDYLQDLGITALYLNPIFQSASNHRYHTHDYYQVDPLLGGDEAFASLLGECKRRGLRLVLDGVFNHASRGFYRFNDVLENGAASPWLDWFTFRGHPANAYDHNRPPGYVTWFGLHALPKLNTDNPQVREYLMQVGEYWVRRGIDGWRLDVPLDITAPGFWQEFRQRIRRINPEAYIVAEIWHRVPEHLTGDTFDATMNYPFAEAVIAFTARSLVRPAMVGERGYRPYPALSGIDYAARIDSLLAEYPWSVQLVQYNLLDSHDTTRFLTLADGDVASLELALLLLCTYPGAPSIYYGDEIGLAGGPSDALARRTFPWDRPRTWNRELLQFTKDVIRLRHEHAALRTGAYKTLAAGKTTYAFARLPDEDGGSGDHTIVVAVNAGEEADTIDVPLEALPASSGAPRLIFGAAEVLARGGLALHLQIPARSGAVLELTHV